MLNPVINILFTSPDGSTSIEFNFANEVEIQRSRKTLTSTCKIKLPRKMIFLNGDINTIMKRGSSVVVKLGYNGVLRTEFTGYISRVSAKIPLEISCEDGMWLLKQNTFSKAWKKVSLEEVIRYVYPGEARIAKFDLGGFVIKQQNTAQVLESLKTHTILCYFDTDGVLVADFASSTKKKPVEVIYDFNENVVENNLEYVKKDDIRVRVRGISKLSTGKTIEVVLGDADGDETPLKRTNMDKENLTKDVEENLNVLKQEGYKNTFKTFGLPAAEPGNVAIMKDKEYPEREGSYLIQAVTITSGVGGFRRQITLERKLA